MDSMKPAYRFAPPRSCKLIMTLMARNEEDIIQYYIDFHLKHGVDFIIATDNGSTDGTTAVLREYEQRRLLHLIEEPSCDHRQAEWNNRMTEIARNRYGADLIFHCDADEFWHPRSGNLKDEMSHRPEDVLKVDVVNVLLVDRDGEESFPNDCRWAVVNPITPSNYWEETKHRNLFHFRYPRKVMFKTDKRLFLVGQGNHEVINKISSDKEGVSDQMLIYHYPIRGKARFLDKTLFGGRAYQNAKKHSPKEGIHKRRWYAAYEAGRLDDEYRKLLLKQEDIPVLLKEGFIEEMDFDEWILGRRGSIDRWVFHHRLFEYEKMIDDVFTPWAGHKYFAYDLVRNLKPSVIVDLRSDNGSSFLAFCQAVKDGRFDAILHCVDAGAGHGATVETRRAVLANLQEGKDRYYRGMKIEISQAISQVAATRFPDASIDLLNIDGVQTEEEVKGDVEAWLPKMKPEGIVLIDDTFIQDPDYRVYRYWEELRKAHFTIEFNHSYGLGVLCKSKKKHEAFVRRERDWQMRYASCAFDRQCRAMRVPVEHFRHTLLADLQAKAAQRDQALAIIEEMKASKFWKLRTLIRALYHLIRHKIFLLKKPD